MPSTDVAAVTANPWLESLRRSRRRRFEAIRRRRRKLAGRRGVTVIVASMTLVAGAAVAHDDGAPTKRSARTASAASMQQGANGSSVAALQRALGVPADGVYGPITARAVRRFQRKNGLAVDGVAGPATLKAAGVDATGAEESTTSRPSAGGQSDQLERIAQCESGGDPSAVSADGRYRGKYQFSRATWRALGGTGDPADAPEAEQDRRAAALLARDGTSPWPSCA